MGFGVATAVICLTTKIEPFYEATINFNGKPLGLHIGPLGYGLFIFCGILILIGLIGAIRYAPGGKYDRSRCGTTRRSTSHHDFRTQTGPGRA